MFDAINEDPSRRIIDPIEDPMIAHADPIALFPRQFEASGRPSVFGQGPDLPEGPFKNRRFEAVEVLLRRGQDEKLIHGAS
jgi:hypothetical protein